jgi:hypothetical protein
MINPLKFIRDHQPQNSGVLPVVMYYVCIAAVTFGVGLVVGILF